MTDSRAARAAIEHRSQRFLRATRLRREARDSRALTLRVARDRSAARAMRRARRLSLFCKVTEREQRTAGEHVMLSVAIARRIVFVL